MYLILSLSSGLILMCLDAIYEMNVFFTAILRVLDHKVVYRFNVQCVGTIIAKVHPLESVSNRHLETPLPAAYLTLHLARLGPQASS